MTRVEELLTRAVARVTIELESPLHIGSGAEDVLLDGVVVRDANDLPTIPGSSLAGVLRAAYSVTYNESEQVVRELFGHAELGQRIESRVDVSFAHLHDSHNQPTPTRAEASRLEDPLLLLGKTPLVRNHVRIDHHGAADTAGRGLFDEEVVPAGNRFTFELCVSGPSAEADLNKLLVLLSAPSFRLGASSARGLGSVRVVAVHQSCFDLRDPTRFSAFCGLPVDVCADSGDVLPLVESSSQAIDYVAEHPTSLQTEVVDIEALPEGFWLVGGGDAQYFELAEDVEPPDIVPYTEPRVRWEGDRAKLGDFDETTLPLPIIPGSALRGALRHRTAYYFNLYNERYVDLRADPVALQSSKDPDQLIEVFGAAASHDQDAASRRIAGRLHVADVVLSASPAMRRIQHVAIDRFTQAPVDGALFEELAYWRGEQWRIKLTLLQPSEIPTTVRRALRSAIDDLTDGLLMIGSGAGRGHGYLQGQVVGGWPDSLQFADETKHKAGL